MSVVSVVADVAAGALGIIGGAAAGRALGRRFRDVRWKLWTANVGAVVGCSALCAIGLTLGQRWFAIGALGLLAGLLTGLKYGARGGFLPAGGE